MKFSKIFVSSVAVFALIAIFGFGGPKSHAQDHPAYLHALSDLRLMRTYVDQVAPNDKIASEQNHAIKEIEAAIAAIKAASIDDQKDVMWRAPIDATLTVGNRYRKAREAGDAAFNDVNQAEDNKEAHGVKRQALDHIKAANEALDKIISWLAKE